MEHKKYIVLGKTSKNEWLPISLLYPKLENFPSSYDHLLDAQIAKGKLKMLIKSKPEIGKKTPYRIEEV
jgi:hypothetical protein